MKSLLLGIDIGTSACKLVVFNRQGKVIAEDTKSYKTSYPHSGWAEQNPEDWWSSVIKSINSLLNQGTFNAKDIVGIGIDGQSWSAIPIDKSGSVLAPTPIWMDTRAEKEAQWLTSTFGEEKLFNVGGNPITPSYSLPKVLWYRNNHPQMYKNIDKILQSNSYIGYMLTGEFSGDYSQCYGYQCYNLNEKKWDYQLLKDMDLSPDMFPTPVASHKVIGGVSKTASMQTGLIEGTPVVAGGLDAACGALGAGVINHGETQEQGGQAGGMSICTKSYSADPKLILSYHVVPDSWLLQGGTVGGAGVLRWFASQLGSAEELSAKENNTNVYYELDKIAEDIAAGSDGLVFLPYMSGERSPLWNPHAKGVFYGLDFSKTRAHLVRACLEGVGFSLQHNLETAYRSGATVKNMLAVGGAANSRLWTQIKADITGKQIDVPYSDTATPLGAAMLAGVGTGLYSDFSQAVNETVKITRTHYPNKDNHKIYKKQYEKYIQLSETLEPLMKG